MQLAENAKRNKTGTFLAPRQNSANSGEGEMQILALGLLLGVFVVLAAVTHKIFND